MSNLDTEFEAELKRQTPAPIPSEMTARLLAARRHLLEGQGSRADWAAHLRLFLGRSELGWAVAAVLAVLLAARHGPGSSPSSQSDAAAEVVRANAEPPVRLMVGSEAVDVVKGRNGELVRRYRVSYIDPHQMASDGAYNGIPTEETILVPVSLY